ncbi:MAG: hypothetical protein R2799_05685 [Crocinitomicaceae bacterium]
MNNKRFSERIGKAKVRDTFQLDDIDKDLRNSLWNCVHYYVCGPMQNKFSLGESHYIGLVHQIWFSFIKEPIDKIRHQTHDVAKDLKINFYGWDYLKVYDFIDFLATIEAPPFNQSKFIELCDEVLRREKSGYRFVNGVLAPFTSEQEISTIESAINESTNEGWKGVSFHLNESLKCISNKENPDYRNSIKESILALESTCQEITGDENKELGITLKKIKDNLKIHL